MPKSLLTVDSSRGRRGPETYWSRCHHCYYRKSTYVSTASNSGRFGKGQNPFPPVCHQLELVLATFSSMHILKMKEKIWRAVAYQDGSQVVLSGRLLGEGGFQKAAPKVFKLLLKNLLLLNLLFKCLLIWLYIHKYTCLKSLLSL